MVYETCFLAKEMIKWNLNTDFGKRERIDRSQLIFGWIGDDPAPPFNVYNEPDPNHLNIEYLKQLLLNKMPGSDFNLFDRYRALFTLRELNTEESALAIC
jgi:hypothetical protein